MELISITPTCSTFRFNNPIPKTSSLSSHKRPSIPLCCKNPGSNPKPKTSFPLNPIQFLVPLLRGAKKLATLRTQKWVSSVKAYRDSEECVNGGYLESGAFGVALLSVTASAKVRISPYVATLAANPTFVAGMFAWFTAQSLKIVLNFFVERKWDFRIFFSSGGMPSAHSALCLALTTSVALCHGIAGSLFPVSLGFSLIVMYDAIGVRRHAGMQAQVLNMIVQDLFQGHPISQTKLKELLGHTPLQVFAGALIGTVIACICCQSCVVAT